MKYQLVLQLPAASIKDYDAMIELEDAIIESLAVLARLTATMLVRAFVSQA